jgi:plasmid stability protein
MSMPSITVKNIPEELYERLKEAARTHRRSINSEVIVCIEKAVGTRKRDVEAILARAEALREKTAEYTITDDEINAAKRDGRP